MIQFDRVSKHYSKDESSLHDVSLFIPKGDFVTLVGSSGAGKTTLIRLLLGEETPTSGDVYFEGNLIRNVSRGNLPLVRQRIGVVFQDFKLLPRKTASENLAFAMEVAGRPDEDILVDVPNILDLVNLADKGHHFPHQLSGGEQQRLAIARAIINQPDVVIADEPTGNLDEKATHEIVDILKKINDLGTTVILTSHDVVVIGKLKNRMVTLEKGRIVKDTDPQEGPRHHTKRNT